MSSVIDPHAHRAGRPSSAWRNWRQNCGNWGLIRRRRQAQQHDAAVIHPGRNLIRISPGMEYPDAALRPFHQPLLDGVGGGLCAGRKAQLTQDIADMHLGGLG